MKLDVSRIVKDYRKCEFYSDRITKELGIPNGYHFTYDSTSKERMLTSSIHLKKVSDKMYRTTKDLFIWVDELGNITFRCIPRTGLKREDVNEMSQRILDFISKWKEYIIFE
jgi:hypothetical protein